MAVDLLTLRPHVPVVAFGSFLVLLALILFKLIQSWSPKKSGSGKNYLTDLTRSQENFGKSGNKKKRTRKQRPTEISQKEVVRQSVETIGSASNTDLKPKPSTPTLENGDAKTVRKNEKKKSKSKKRRTQAEDITQAVVEHFAAEGAGDGEWHTVGGSKEQRLKREKRKQEDLPLTPPTISKPVSPYPVTTMPSTAKDVAPRFAKAAGEKWTEKVETTPTISRTPLTQAVIPEPKLSSTRLPPITTSISGMWQSPQSKNPLDTLPKTSTFWIDSPSNNATFKKTNNEQEWKEPKSIGSSWRDQGSTTMTSQVWSPSLTDGWVHVSSTSSFPTNQLRQWSGNPPDVAQKMMEREEYLLEPEGYSVPVPDDPWNPGSFDTKEHGDFEPPETNWCNTNDNWETPAIKNKNVVADESSDDDKTPVPPSSVAPSSTGAPQQNVVGAGPELFANKKQKRRRRKKNTQSEPMNVEEVDTMKKEVVAEETTGNKENKSEQMKMDVIDDVIGDWSKAGKKKKIRPRKEE